MEVVVAVAIGVLSAVFVAALIVLIILLRCKCRKTDLLTEEYHKESRQDAQLITEAQESPFSQSSLDVELGDVQLTNPRLEELLNNEQWVDDATGLVPHCLSILKTCHHLTEKLLGMTMGTAPHIRTKEALTEIVSIARRINPRVDEVVQSINPPLDARLLEARFTALVLSVSHLVMITKNACRLSGTLDWIDQSLADVEHHLKFLREASTELDSYCHANAASLPPPPTQGPPQPTQVEADKNNIQPSPLAASSRIDNCRL